MKKHTPVLLRETIEALNIKPNGFYIDLTLGRGGHSSKILKKLTTGKLFAFDKDIYAITESNSHLKKINKNYILIHSDFKNFKNELNKRGIKKVDSILADLGVSSPQLDITERGFSYNKDAKLDMRMDQSQKLNAYDVVNKYSEKELENIFRNYADVKLPKRVAKGLISKRPIFSTLELVECIRDSLPAAIVRKKNPAKAVFQAIRIEVNNEIESLKKMLSDAVKLLNVKGNLAIITFHSIEDKIVKQFFNQYIKDETGKLPIQIEKKYKVKTFKPSKEEILINNRSRSAKLRVLTKLID